jgi:hypothetical protein
MNDHTLAVLLGIGIPAAILFIGSVVLFSKTRTLSALLQLLGAGSLMMVVMSHVGETFGLLPWMQWGLPDSIGHYLDFCRAALGLALFPAGYLLHTLAAHPTRQAA